MHMHKKSEKKSKNKTRIRIIIINDNLFLSLYCVVNSAFNIFLKSIEFG
jgi:hypothetical protein